MWGACWVSFRLLALTQPEPRRKSSAGADPGLVPSTSQSNTLPEASVSVCQRGEMSKDGTVPEKNRARCGHRKVRWGSRPAVPQSHCSLWPQAFGVTLRQDDSSSSPRANSPSGNRPLSQTLTAPRTQYAAGFRCAGTPLPLLPGVQPLGLGLPRPPGTPYEEAWLQPQTWEGDPRAAAITPNPQQSHRLGSLFYPLLLLLLPPLCTQLTWGQGTKSREEAPHWTGSCLPGGTVRELGEGSHDRNPSSPAISSSLHFSPPPPQFPLLSLRRPLPAARGAGRQVGPGAGVGLRWGGRAVPACCCVLARIRSLYA